MECSQEGRQPLTSNLSRQGSGGQGRTHDILFGDPYACRASLEGNRETGRRRRRPAGDAQNALPRLKMGRYMATTSPPTSTPRITMMKGSMRLDMLSTALSTSS